MHSFYISLNRVQKIFHARIEVKNVVKQALIKATIEDAYSDGAEFIYEGGQLGYKTTITNVSDETLTNVVVTSKLPEGTKLDEYEETRVFLINSDGEETKKEVEIENDKIICKIKEETKS